MARLQVEDVPDEVMAAIDRRAAAMQRSRSAEVRVLLEIAAAGYREAVDAG